MARSVWGGRQTVSQEVVALLLVGSTPTHPSSRMQLPCHISQPSGGLRRPGPALVGRAYILDREAQGGGPQGLSR